MEKNCRKNEKIHAIMIPYPLQGHVIPFVNLAIKLAANYSFTITFINTQSVHHQISINNSGTGSDDIFAGARESGLDIRYRTISDGFPLSFNRSLNHDQFMEGILHVFSAHVDEIVGEIVQLSEKENCLPVNCLIVDTFFVWPSIIADKYDLVNVSFWTEPALVLTLYYHLDLLKQNSHFASQDNRIDTIDYIPGVPSIDPKDLMSYLKSSDIWTPVHQIIYKSFTDVKKADFIICNTINELEPETISAIHKKQPTYAIGPIFPRGFTKGPVATSMLAESDCIQWLNSKPERSILYISFGSYAHTTKHDIVEIANGLLLSGLGFIWVLRPDIVSSDDTDFLPEKFLENVGSGGLVVPWCSQIDVISHPSIGGFLTHCGWNSILESIWCAVPLLCYPLLTDQFTNRKLVVDDWKVGINLCDEEEITKDEVTKKMNTLMDGKESEETRKEIKRIKTVLEDSLGLNGSSERNLKEFVEKLETKVKRINE
ncbi:UDP-glycosyltransferase 86A1-like [Impatiens glandulifera]|uniref:UDP-glycosyltransferase 86A1-like n=1 Tax=Impatiens glandulifera TaxID=253017 RepID=UPI001FB13B72|nr:UDP-glycosyltransferase 86A1-like [Impatiens glandulifera]